MRDFIKQNFTWIALHYMAEIAGYDYCDCVSQKDWLYSKTWTKEQSDSFKDWFMQNYPERNKTIKQNIYNNFDLMYGFKIDEDRTKFHKQTGRGDDSPARSE